MANWFSTCPPILNRHRPSFLPEPHQRVETPASSVGTVYTTLFFSGPCTRPSSSSSVSCVLCTAHPRLRVHPPAPPPGSQSARLSIQAIRISLLHPAVFNQHACPNQASLVSATHKPSLRPPNVNSQGDINALLLMQLYHPVILLTHSTSKYTIA